MTWSPRGVRQRNEPTEIAMKTILFNGALASPMVSFILLDWNCRESFHSLDYLARQDVPRSDYEIIWIEFYGRRAGEINQRVAAAKAKGEPPPLDNWIIVEMPSSVYYHKHLMYNIAIAQARGKIIVICDSDAMFEPSFVRTLSDVFAADPDIVLHIDEVRNARRDFYPFNYPSFEEVRGSGALNWRDGMTTGLSDTTDPLHSRNYGACLCAWRRDLIAIGGADEHLHYLGHVCGPYELTFRLVNLGRREVWHQSHFIYHTWHPGTDGHRNYIGPNDGRGMSTTALDIRKSGRVEPLRENKAIRLQRTGTKLGRDEVAQALVDPAYERVWNEKELANSDTFALFAVPQDAPKLIGEFGSCNVVRFGGKIWAVPRYLGTVELDDLQGPFDPRIRHADTIEAAMAAVARGEDDARRLFGEGAKYDVVERNGAWMAIPHSIAPNDWSALALLDGVLTAASREELVICALQARLRDMGAAGAELLGMLGEWRASPAAPKAPPDIASAVATGATEQSSMMTIMARLDEIAAVTQTLTGRVDRIGAISERALLAAADLHHRIAAGVPGNPSRQLGVLRWSLRQPRKALRRVLNRLRTALKADFGETDVAANLSPLAGRGRNERDLRAHSG
jgi:hypothetical protein